MYICTFDISKYIHIYIYIYINTLMTFTEPVVANGTAPLSTLFLSIFCAVLEPPV